MGNCFSSDSETTDTEYHVLSGPIHSSTQYSILDPILPARNDMKLQIGSWNIKDLGFLNITERNKSIVDVINTDMKECDVILIQELINDFEFSKMEAVGAEFANVKDFVFTMTRQDTGNGKIQLFNGNNKNHNKQTEHFGVFYNPLKVSLVLSECRFIELWNIDGKNIPYPGSRIPFMYVFQRTSGYGKNTLIQKYYIINVHLAPSARNKDTRKKELNYIHEFCKQLPYNGTHAIIVGDMNFENENEIQEQKQLVSFQFTNMGTKTNTNPKSSKPYDNILISDYYDYSFRVIVKDEMDKLSDHYPIISSLQKRNILGEKEKQKKSGKRKEEEDLKIEIQDIV